MEVPWWGVFLFQIFSVLVAWIGGVATGRSQMMGGMMNQQMPDLAALAKLNQGGQVSGLHQQTQGNPAREPGRPAL